MGSGPRVDMSALRDLTLETAAAACTPAAVVLPSDPCCTHAARSWEMTWPASIEGRSRHGAELLSAAGVRRYVLEIPAGLPAMAPRAMGLAQARGPVLRL